MGRDEGESRTGGARLGIARRDQNGGNIGFLLGSHCVPKRFHAPIKSAHDPPFPPPSLTLSLQAERDAVQAEQDAAELPPPRPPAAPGRRETKRSSMSGRLRSSRSPPADPNLGDAPLQPPSMQRPQPVVAPSTHSQVSDAELSKIKKERKSALSAELYELLYGEDALVN